MNLINVYWFQLELAGLWGASSWLCWALGRHWCSVGVLGWAHCLYSFTRHAMDLLILQWIGCCRPGRFLVGSGVFLWLLGWDLWVFLAGLLTIVGPVALL